MSFKHDPSRSECCGLIIANLPTDDPEYYGQIHTLINLTRALHVVIFWCTIHNGKGDDAT
jgi:hypothetical protein